MRQAWVWLLLLFLVTDARFQPTSYGYDEAGRQTTQTDALGRVTRYAHADPVNGTDPSGHFTLTELSVSMGNSISNYGQRAYSAYNVYSRVTDAIDLAEGIYWCFGLAATIYYDATSSAGLAPGDSDSLEMLSSEASPQVMTAGIGGNSATGTFLAGSAIYALWQRAASNVHHIATNKHGIWTPDF